MQAIMETIFDVVFAFYIPVVLFTNTIPLIGIFMIPKTCAYVWTVFIGYNEMKKGVKLYI